MEELIVALHMHTVYSDGTGKLVALAAAILRKSIYR
jgi:predicted metal-dependent phosphoesterase TrpH